MEQLKQYDEQLTKKLIEYDTITEQYGIPLDGLLAWGTMFGLYAMDFKPIPILISGAVIHGYVHPRISHKQ